MNTWVIVAIVLVLVVISIGIFVGMELSVQDSITNSSDSSEVTTNYPTSSCAYEVCLSSPADTLAGSYVGTGLITLSDGLDWVLTTNGTDLYNAKINFTINKRPYVNDDHTKVADFLNISNVSITAGKFAPEDTFSIIMRQEKGFVTVNTTSIENVPMTVHIDVVRGKVTYGKTVQTITMYLESDGKVYSDNVQIRSYGLEPLEHVKEKDFGSLIELRFDKPYYDEGLQRIAQLKEDGYSIVKLSNEASINWHDDPTTVYIALLEQ